jgi:TrmH family RNA methyltransferase
VKESIINSVKNEQIKYLNKLKQKKYRDEYGLYLIEGIKIITEAVLSGEELVYLIYDERYISSDIDAKHRLFVTNGIIKYLSSLENPPGIIAAVRIKNKRNDMEGDKWVMLDEVKDPSNAAAIVRSADCAGFDGVIFANNSVDIYNEKFLRAAMGSNYHIKLINADNAQEQIDYFKENGYCITGSCLKGSEKEEIKNDKTVLIIGNESKGISEDLLKKCDCLVKIPIYGKAESLNAACAASVLMYMINGYIK